MTLHAYIQHYHQCQLRQTPRHQVHGSLQPILTPPRPFHTISIDFILALPLSRPEKYDCVMSVSDKFSKAITLIPGNIAASGKVWAVLLLDCLSLMFWGLSRAILSDRDRRFVGQLWQGIFDKLSVSLLYSTSYHPQTDGMSERTNQTVEIALRYYLSILPDMYRWPTVLPRLSHALCNSKNFSSTGKTPTQVLYGFKTREPLDFLHVEEGEPVQLEEGDLGYHSGGDDLQDLIQVQRDAHLETPEEARPDLDNETQDTPTRMQSIADDLEHYDEGFITTAYPIATRRQNRRPLSPTDHLDDNVDEPAALLVLPRRHQLPMANMNEYRPTHIDAKDAIAFAAMAMKRYYNLHHRPTFFKVGDLVNLRLHRGYSMPSITNHKIDQQFARPFAITKRIGRLAYELDLPNTMKIHPVISVAHLEPATKPEDDPFHRQRPAQNPPIIVDGQEEYEVERLLRKRVIRKGRGYSTQYLIRWVGWGPEGDCWRTLHQLGNAQDRVDKFEAQARQEEEEVLP